MTDILQEMRAARTDDSMYCPFTEKQRKILLLAVNTSTFSGDCVEDVAAIKQALQNPAKVVSHASDHGTDVAAEPAE